jgi:hypothetical protein
MAKPITEFEVDLTVQSRSPRIFEIAHRLGIRPDSTSEDSAGRGPYYFWTISSGAPRKMPADKQLKRLLTKLLKFNLWLEQVHLDSESISPYIQIAFYTNLESQYCGGPSLSWETLCRSEMLHFPINFSAYLASKSRAWKPLSGPDKLIDTSDSDQRIPRDKPIRMVLHKAGKVALDSYYPSLSVALRSLAKRSSKVAVQATESLIISPCDLSPHGICSEILLSPTGLRFLRKHRLGIDFNYFRPGAP